MTDEYVLIPLDQPISRKQAEYCMMVMTPAVGYTLTFILTKEGVIGFRMDEIESMKEKEVE